jgi:hypothetical protein
VSGPGATEVAAATVAAVLSIAALRWFLRREPDRLIRRVIVVALGAKLVGTVVYYRVIADVYGFGDVTAYVREGRTIATVIRSGTLPEQAKEAGTRFLEFLTGLTFAVFGSSEIVGYFVFSLLSFAGMIAFFKAFQLAVPEADHRRYALFLFFLPTMVFWPSTIGKDAWLVFTLGLASYGAAGILEGQRFAYPLTAISLAGAAAVRPHMALLFMASFAGAYLLQLRHVTARQRTAAWLLGLAMIGGGLTVAAGYFSSEMAGREPGERLTFGSLVSDAEQVMEETDQNTQLGGSEFENRPVRSFGDFVYALTTLPFRPFPHEAHNVQARIASLEGVALLLVVLVSLPRLTRLPQAALRSPYFAFAAIYTAGFLIAFSNFANLGLLSRQRTQLMPYLLVLLVVPLTAERRDEAGALRPGRRAGPAPRVRLIVPGPSDPGEGPRATDRDRGSPPS